MRKLLGIAVAAGAVVAVASLGKPAGQTAFGDAAYAQSKSSACYQDCRRVRKWPAEQCRRHCRGRS